MLNDSTAVARLVWPRPRAISRYTQEEGIARPSTPQSLLGGVDLGPRVDGYLSPTDPRSQRFSQRGRKRNSVAMDNKARSGRIGDLTSCSSTMRYMQGGKGF